MNPISEVEFRTNQLQRCFEKSREAERKWGPEVGPRYINRVTLLLEAETLGDLMSLHFLHCHPLTGDREGQYAITLTGQVRLMFHIDEEDGTISVIEVGDYHG